MCSAFVSAHGLERGIFKCSGYYHFEDYGTAGLRKQHYKTTAGLHERFLKSDILWAGYSAI